jgi:hypothetical protein
MVIILTKIQPNFGYKLDMKYKPFNHPCISLAMHSKPNIKIWQFLLFPPISLAIEKPPKSFYFHIFIFKIFLIGEILMIKKGYYSFR